MRSFNTASVLIQLVLIYNKDTIGMFQYSFCSYSTDTTKAGFKAMGRFNTASVLIQQFEATKYSVEYIVSIQLLFLFNAKGTATTNAPFRGFNTASVLIQLLFDEIGDEEALFQYSFCSYSTVKSH